MAKTIQQPRTSGETRPPRPPRPSLAVRALVGVVATLSLIIAVGSASGFAFYQWANGQIITIHHKELELPCRNGCNYLVLGSDSRAGLSKSQQSMFGDTTTVGGHCSDTIMLVHLNSDRKQAVVLSFPRDLWVNIPHQGYDKLTSAYEGGPPRVAKTLENLSGLNISGFLGVNLAGFEKVVDALGGVPICVDRPMFDDLSGLNLPHAGCYNLGGFQALAFVRSRHVQGDCIPDFSRIGRQQQFLRAVIAKILTPGELVHAPSLIKAMADNLTVDNLNIADLVHLTTELRGVSTGNADFRAVPGTTGTISSTGQSVVFMSNDAKILFRRLANGKALGNIGKVLDLTPPTPANIRIRVFDDSSDGKAEQVNGLLTKAGFDIRDLKSTGLPTHGGALLYKPDTKEMANVVHGFLPTLGMREVKDEVLSEVDVAVVIPASYNGPPLTSPPATGPSSGGTSAGC